jgi:predicted ester cyclase
MSCRIRRSLVLVVAVAFPAYAGDPGAIDELVVARSIPEPQSSATEAAARAFYDFWNTGDEARLREAIAPAFIDHTLPPGRPQGPDGPAYASRQFRAAVPDLRVRVVKLIIAEAYVTAHLNFTGHFTGKFGSTTGNGQPIDFIATDLLKVQNGRIADNWHLEDNLTLLSKMGIAKVSP